MNKYTLFILLLIPFYVQAQLPGTFPPISSEIAFIRENIITKEDSLASDTLIRLPIQPYIFQNTTEVGLSLKDLNRGIAILNHSFFQTGVQFYLLAPEYIVNPNLFNYNRFSEEPLVLAEGFSTEAINLYCFNTVQDFSDNDVWGYTYFPSETLTNQIFVRNDAIRDGRELARLLGHYFGLFNTSETSAGIENTNGNNCAEAGDLICDTPADPKIGIEVDTLTCTHNGSTLNAPDGGNYEKAPIENIMSLHKNKCAVNFTEQQKKRLLAGAKHKASVIAFTDETENVLVPAALQGRNYGRYTTLLWTDIADNELGYWIERSIKPESDFQVIGGLAPNSTSFLDTTVVVGETYYYRITAANSGFRYSEIIIVEPQTNYCAPSYTQSCTTSTISEFNFPSLGVSTVFTSCVSEQYKVFDFTNSTLQSNSNYSLELELGGEAQLLTLWADLDGNGTFDLTEKLIEETTANINSYSNSFRVPSDAKTGITRFRLRTRRATEGNIDSPCDTYGAGITLDFWFTMQGSENPCVAFDKAILGNIYNQLGGENWNSATNWESNLPLRNWQGVSVNTQGCVSSLSLPNNNLQGELPESLFQLNSLTSLNLSGNELIGGIPIQIENLRNLISLSLNNNQLEGVIPEKISKLTQLVFIELDNNNLSGEVPGGFKNLSLIGMDLKNNQLTKLPDLSNILTWNSGTTGLEVQNNLLSFDDILPHLPIRDFEYNPQKPFLSLDTITINHGTNYTINLGIDSTITDNKYSWKRDNETLLETNKNTLLIDSTNLPGFYRYEVEVTNPAVENFKLTANPIFVNILPTDSTALAAFYNSTNGGAWQVKWDLSQPISTWFGLSFNSEGRVRRISLNGNNINGVIPPEFIYLTELQDLRLGNNKINAGFENLVNLKKLRVLWLYQNQLSGEIPKALGAIENLEELLLYSNQFSGKIPEELGQLTKLKSLSLNDNLLEGTVPETFKNLVNLEALRLEDNKLIGLTDLSSITSWEFFTFSGLQVQNNQLTFEDIIPNLPIFNYTYTPQLKIGEEKQVTINLGNTYTIALNIDDTLTTNQYKWYRDDELLLTTDTNRLTVNEIGVYRAEVTNTQAPKLTLESFPVTLTIPSVDSIHLAGFYEKTNGNTWNRPWDVSTPVTSWEGVTFNRLGRVIKLDLSFNNIQGELPFDLGLLSELEELNLSGNKITLLPELFIALQKLKTVNLSFNELTTFPVRLFEIASVERIELQNNNMVGSIGEDINKLENLVYLDVSDNHLENLPNIGLTQLGVGENAGLQLQNNKLSFTDIKPNVAIPNISYSPQQVLGKEETVVLDESQQYTIDLAIENALSDNKYRWIRNGVTLENIPNEQTLEVTSSGVYQVEVTNDSVPGLTLFNNLITVQNPTIDSLALVALYTSTDGANWQNPWDLTQPMEFWEGITLDDSRSVSEVTLENRGLTGTLPEDLNKFQSVVNIDLSNNNLSGEIPTAFGELSTLVSLDLSFNQLAGEAPNNLANLTRLATLLLNNNQLTGLPAMSPSNLWSLESEGGFQVQNNLLTFEDLLKNQNIPNFNYSPQAEIGEEKSEIIYFDNKPVIDLKIDSQVTSNRYKWLKDDVLFDETTEEKFTLLESGSYFAQVTNPALPNLTLTSKKTIAERFEGTNALRVDSDSYRRIDVRWVDNDSLETGYIIERALNSDLVFAPTGTVESNQVIFADKQLEDNTRYAYRIQTQREEGKSFYSDTVRITTPSIDFNAEQTEIQVGETAKFGLTSSILPASVAWDFGDLAFPSTASEFRPTVRYNNGERSYDVRLEAISEKGDTATIFKEDYITTFCPDVTPVILVDRFILISTFAQSYQWVLNGELLEETTQQISALKAGEYQVQILDSLGCTGISDPVQITVTSLDSEKELSSINIFPNPSKGKFHVVLPKQSEETPFIKVFSLDGQRHKYQSLFTLKDENWETTIDLSTQPKGLYLLYIRAGDKQSVRKIVLE